MEELNAFRASRSIPTTGQSVGNARLLAAEEAGAHGSAHAVRAISAANAGRWTDHHTHKAKAAEHFAKALSLLNPAGQSEQRKVA